MNTANTFTYRLKMKTLLGFVELIIIIILFLFVPAGSFNFWQAWVYSIIFVGSSAAITFYLWRTNPELLARRVNAGPGAEKEKLRNLYSFFPPYCLLPFSLFPHLIIVLVGRMSRYTLSFWATFL